VSGIFGVYFRDASLVSPETINSLRHSMEDWGCDRVDVWYEKSVCLGQALATSTTESQFECNPCIDKNTGIAFSVAGRVDNRIDLANELEISPVDMHSLADGELIRRAYYRWGEQACSRIYGDWSFAAWHSLENRLFIARDHFGSTALYYHVDQSVFAFSSSRQALLDLNLAPVKMDELYLAQVLISWPNYHGERTIHSSICRLRPAHLITIDANTCFTRQYWYLEETPLLNYSNRADYISAFNEVFNEAVCARLRSPNSTSKIGVALSGGLDSSSVAVTAAKFLHDSGGRLNAYTSAPISTNNKADCVCMVDEFPYAEATSRFAGNIDLYPITAADISPIQAIKIILKISQEPNHAAANFFWILKLYQCAAEHGCKVLLTGKSGNAGISWTGDIFSQPLAYQIHRLGWYKWLKTRIKYSAPPSLMNTYRKLVQRPDWSCFSAIHPDFASRLQLKELRLDDPDENYKRYPHEQRLDIIKPGRQIGGAFQAGLGAAYGLEVRDPTADARVLAFTFSVPDYIFMDPKTGQNRWLIREAMKGRLPEEVRLNRKHGQQAADLVHRLRATTMEVESTLNELDRGPATAYVDVACMRQVWRRIQAENSHETYVKSITILTRGIMAGLFVNQFYE